MSALAVRGTGKFGFGSLLASGDLQFITSATGTAVASISVNDCFSASFDHYLVMRNLLMSSAGNYIYVRLRVGGADASGTDYRYQYVNASAASVTGSRGAAASSWPFALGYGEATTIGFSQLWISNPFAAVRTTAWTNHSNAVTGNIELQSVVHEHDLATSYTGFTAVPNVGTVTGDIAVFGLAV